MLTKNNYCQEAVINKINLINTEDTINYYDKKSWLLSKVKIPSENTHAKYWNYRFQLEKLTYKQQFVCTNNVLRYWLVDLQM